MIEAGFAPDFPPDVGQEILALPDALEPAATDDTIRDMRELLWSSIDNSESRDLDQVEYAEPLANGEIRVLIGIADVDAFVPKGSATDRQAFENTVSVYTPGTVFPMLPEALSAGQTSLLAGLDRLALIIELVVTSEGETSAAQVYRAIVRNRAKLVYERVGEWLDGRAPAPVEM